ncbi:hypothetical protein PVL29_011014 [Vitis rotundifolia]|uniref:SAM-dependent methyltransferase Erg6/SMT-type domain-containing protein n=1 Tax=Vitis rotundifolia TaxID=103349 RepID=A0AA38ZVI9_VITRO|nr:hypothetical protein PVL29_011014 [Vitis rotundifolia]
MKMPFSNDTFDAVFAIEATCHAPDDGEVELDNGLPDIRSVGQYSPLPWYLPLDTTQFSLSSVRTTAFGRFITRNMVKALEFVRLAPEGSQRVQAFLEKAAEALVEGGREGIFTPMFFLVARKPRSIEVCARHFFY